MSWGLYDPRNPSLGVWLQYLGGDACPGKRSRQLRIWFLCYDDATNIPDDELVLESNTCAYDIFLKSAYGCPLQCPLVTPPGSGTRRICAGHGVCDFDAARGNSRCFCNDGWGGDDCTVAAGAPTKVSTASAILIVVTLVLVLTLAFLAYVWVFKISRLRLDPAAYSTLASGAGDEDRAPSMSSAPAKNDGSLQ